MSAETPTIQPPKCIQSTGEMFTESEEGNKAAIEKQLEAQYSGWRGIFDITSRDKWGDLAAIMLRRESYAQSFVSLKMWLEAGRGVNERVTERLLMTTNDVANMVEKAETLSGIIGESDKAKLQKVITLNVSANNAQRYSLTREDFFNQLALPTDLLDFDALSIENAAQDPESLSAELQRQLVLFDTLSSPNNSVQELSNLFDIDYTNIVDLPDFIEDNFHFLKKFAESKVVGGFEDEALFTNQFANQGREAEILSKLASGPHTSLQVGMAITDIRNHEDWALEFRKKYGGVQFSTDNPIATDKTNELINDVATILRGEQFRQRYTEFSNYLHSENHDKAAKILNIEVETAEKLLEIYRDMTNSFDLRDHNMLIALLYLNSLPHINQRISREEVLGRLGLPQEIIDINTNNIDTNTIDIQDIENALNAIKELPALP